jgi:hypothetical protein
LKVFRPEIYGRPEAEIGFAKGNEGRNCHYGICREMMGLQLKALHEIPSEIASRKSEASLEMGNKDNVLTRTRHRGKLASREPAFNFQWDTPREAEPFDIGGGHIGPFPSSTGLVHHHLLLRRGGDDGGA